MTERPAYYITTAISYPHRAPHIGHAYTAIATDVLARFQRLDGKDVFFLSGTDEHGQKMQQTAAREGVTAREFADRQAPRFAAMAAALNCPNDDFIRTTEARHAAASRDIWERMAKAGDIYKDTYSGWYSVRDEAYYQEAETVVGDDGIRRGPQNTPVDWVEEESYFFRLSAYQDKLLALYRDTPDFIGPDERRNEVVRFVEGGLRDLSISRTTFDWGIPVPGDEPAEVYLERLCREGMARRYPGGAPDGAEERLRFELGVIEEMGFASYFLIVWDYMHWARENGVGVGPGRGSAAGSLVAYTLRIVDLDPLAHDLLFERFLNPGRKSMPDIDTDFSVAGRDRVVQYVTQKYGSAAVARIGTFGKLLARAVVRDSGRVLGHSYGQVDRIAKLVPERPIGIKLADAMKSGTELAQAYNEDPVTKQILDTARPLEGLVRNEGVHAAGVVIAPSDITDYVPVRLDDEGNVVTQVPDHDVEALGLLKMDFLGLRNLDVIQGCLALIEEGGEFYHGFTYSGHPVACAVALENLRIIES